MGRKSIAEVETRRVDVRDMLLRGKSTSHIMAYITTNYGIARSTIEHDITAVYGELRKYFERETLDIISEHVSRYEKIYEDCMDIGNVRDAMKALEQKEKLLALHRQEPFINISNNTNTINFNHLSVEKIQELLNVK